ncbi:MAG: GAF domain-containing protein [Actinomycetia bacterium]|nr:GAF domain-containing protein [Actinomycetes bacterium]
MSDQTPDESRPDPSDLPAVSRLAAGNALRERLKDSAGLVPIADAAAHFIYDYFEADASALTLIRGEWYRALVTVGEPAPGQIRHPDGETYSVDEYPTIIGLLRSGSGYVASVGNHGGVPESQKFLTEIRKTSCLGAPIAYGGDVVGEMFASRAKGRPYFTGHDLAALLDLARQIGYRIGPAVRAMDARDPAWWPEGTSADAIRELGDPLP